MSTTKIHSDTPSRRKSDQTLLGKSSQDLDNRVYTLEFGVNLSQIGFEGLNNYVVGISCLDKSTGKSETLTSALEINHQFASNTLNIEGGPPFGFSVSKNTMDLECTDIDESIVKAVNKGIAWLRGEITDSWIKKNRRRVPAGLLEDRIAVCLLISSISTIIGGSMECHHKVIRESSTCLPASMIT